jgi:hypothetical protein
MLEDAIVNGFSVHRDILQDLCSRETSDVVSAYLRCGYAADGKERLPEGITPKSGESHSEIVTSHMTIF